MADYLFRNALRSRSSRFSFWPSFFFIFFLKWAESHSAGLKVLCCYSFFIPLRSGSSRYCPLALWEVTPGFLLFLLDHLVPEKDVPILCFLCSFGFFLWAVLILSWLYYMPRGSRAFWQSLRIPTQLSFHAGNSSIFWSGLLFFFFLSSFLINFRACLFFLYVFWASSLLGLPLLLFFHGPLCLFLWAWMLWFFGPQHNFNPKIFQFTFQSKWKTSCVRVKTTSMKYLNQTFLRRSNQKIILLY